MRNNIWLTIEDSLANSWWDWIQWYRSDQTGPEPVISEWDKRALLKVIDVDFMRTAFKVATITALAPKTLWQLWSMYDIKVPEWIDAGYAQHGEAMSGGDLGVAGLWTWNPGNPLCAYDDNGGEYPWKPNQVILFMPDVCVDPPDCTSYVPAVEITDVSLLFSQPPREFPSQPT